MLPESTTTMGEGLSVATERPFQSMKAVERTRAKLRSWVRARRGLRVVVENMFFGGFWGRRELARGEEVGGGTG